MQEHGPIVPPQTITISSEQLGRELADRLRTELAMIDLFAEGGVLILRCNRCMTTWRYAPPMALISLIREARDHECAGRR